MIAHPGLQDTSVSGPSSAGATQVATAILAGDLTVDECIRRASAHVLACPRVDAVMAALTRIAPDEPDGWRQLGGRAWLREWVRPGTDLTLVPPPGAGPEAALTMPWMSRLVRDHGVVAITQRELLPPDAARDIAELRGPGVHGLISSRWASGEDMFGSMSAISIDGGTWPDALLQDFKLLNAALTARLTLEQSRRLLAEAIEVGSQAQETYHEFYGAVGHELRTPVSSILGYTEMLLDEAAQTPAESVSAGMLRDGPVIVRQCERLLAIVDGLLGAGRSLSGDEKRQDVEVADAVADVVHWHRTPAGVARVELVTDGVARDAIVRAHPSGVRQVLTSLVGNAIAHHHPDGGAVHVSTTTLLGESGREMVRIIVRDDGPGLPPEQLERVFDPFVQFGGPGAQGSGLGLSMARTIAERDGGAVRGESTPGVGSSFWLELPVRDPSA
ncbi:hypothetical protein GCM10023339_05890 [Alloalcanivorax gelatiniphagus]